MGGMKLTASPPSTLFSMPLSSSFSGKCISLMSLASCRICMWVVSSDGLTINKLLSGNSFSTPWKSLASMDFKGFPADLKVLVPLISVQRRMSFQLGFQGKLKAKSHCPLGFTFQKVSPQWGMLTQAHQKDGAQFSHSPSLHCAAFTL